MIVPLAVCHKMTIGVLAIVLPKPLRGHVSYRLVEYRACNHSHCHPSKLIKCLEFIYVVTDIYDQVEEPSRLLTAETYTLQSRHSLSPQRT